MYSQSLWPSQASVSDVVVVMMKTGETLLELLAFISASRVILLSVSASSALSSTALADVSSLACSTALPGSVLPPQTPSPQHVCESNVEKEPDIPMVVEKQVFGFLISIIAHHLLPKQCFWMLSLPLSKHVENLKQYL